MKIPSYDKVGQHLVVLVCMLIIAAHVPVRTEYGYFCDYTGSCKQWTTWLWLVETDYRHQKSRLEAFVEERHASSLQHKWIKFCGTTTFFLAGTSFAHRSPGPLFYLPWGLRDRWCDAVSDEEKMRLYDLLRKGDENAIQAKIGEMEQFMQQQPGLQLK